MEWQESSTAETVECKPNTYCALWDFRGGIGVCEVQIQAGREILTKHELAPQCWVISWLADPIGSEAPA